MNPVCTPTTKTRFSFRVVLAALALACAAFLVGSASAAARTDSISPSAAPRGAEVELRGGGFGARNVNVWVGGAPAEVVSANGNRVLFRVPNSAPLGATIVEAANPGGKRASIPFTVLGGAFSGSVQPVPDTDLASTASIGRSGGTISTGGLTLTIPAGALSETEQITVTPLLGLNGSPLQGQVVGAVFAPDGLVLLAPAILTFPAPAGTAAAEILTFGFTGNGQDFHLVPHEFEGGVVELEVWHFSGAGGHFGSSQGRPTWIPGTAETQALQEVALAANACDQTEDPNSQACAVELPDRLRAALLRWYVDAVERALNAARGAPSIEVEAAFIEWLRWSTQVARFATATFPLLTLQDRLNEAEILATKALADLARRRLNNCTGTDLRSQLRDVVRITDLAVAGAIDLTTEGLPSAFNAGLIKKCASVKIVDPPTFPTVAARGDANQLGVRTYIGTSTDAKIMTEPLELTLTLTNADSDASQGVPDSNGDFQTNIYPFSAAPGVIVDIAVALGANALPQLMDAFVRKSLGSTMQVIRSARDRIELEPLPGVSTTVNAGTSVPLKVRVAGNGMANATVGYSVSGPGSVSSTSGVTNQDGEAPTFDYIAPANSFGTTATVTATLGSDQTSVTFTIPNVNVSVNPTSVSLSAGQTRQFTATVAGTPNTAVTWTATGGTISSSGLYTAGSVSGSFGVTATSVADPTQSATAGVTIAGAAVTLVERYSDARAECSATVWISGQEPVSPNADDRKSATDVVPGLVSLDASVGEAATASGPLGQGNASCSGSANGNNNLTIGPTSLVMDYAGNAVGTGNASFTGLGSASGSVGGQTGHGIIFVTIGNLPYTAEGTFGDSVSGPSSFAHGAELVQLSGAFPIPVFSHQRTGDHENPPTVGPSLLRSGTLAPGRYRLTSWTRCGVGAAVNPQNGVSSPAAQCGSTGNFKFTLGTP